MSGGAMGIELGGGMSLEGFSLGGIETALRVPELRLAIDVGRGRLDLLRCDHLALTHSHIDHAGGLPYIIGLRQLYRLPPPTVYVPAQVARELADMLDAWRRLQRFELACEIVAVEPGARYPLRRDVWLEPFRTYHPVPSFGYTVVEEVRKLRPELIGRAGHEIAALRAQGHEVSAVVRRPRLSVTGDTLVEVLERQPQILESEALVIECTFLDERKPLEASRAGGHIHLVELLPWAERFRNATVVLSHFSQIYAAPDIASSLAPFAARVEGEVWALATDPEGAPRVIAG